MKKFTLGTTKDEKPLHADMERLLLSKAIIQANSGGGKSYMLRLMLEACAAQMQTIVLDAEGEFASLREKFDMVLVGAGGELDADPRSAPELARKLLELNVSAVIDLYSIRLPQRKEFVRLFCESIVDAPKALWHPCMFAIDEAHVFAPEKGHGEAESLDAVISLSSLGRKRAFGLILATQRLGKLNKDAAAECNNVLIGRTVLDTDVKRAKDMIGLEAKEAMATLRELDPGEWFAYGPALDAIGVVRFRGAKVQTTHPEPGTRHKLKPPEPSAKVAAIAGQLKAAAKERDIADPLNMEQARASITDLRRQLKAAARIAPPKAQPVVQLAPSPKAAELRRMRTAMEELMKFVVTITTKDFDLSGAVDKAAIAKVISDAVDRGTGMIEQKLDLRAREMKALQTRGTQIVERLTALLADDTASVHVEVQQNKAFTIQSNGHAPWTARPAPTVRTTQPAAGPGDAIPKGERAVLIAIAQHDEGVTREQLTILTGYKRSTRDTYLQRLGEKAYVKHGDTITATQAGIDALGSDFEPLPTGDALREHWLRTLPEGERKILEVLTAAYPNPVQRQDLDGPTGFKRSTRDTYLQRLTARRLIEAARDGVKASDMLFDGVAA